MKAGKSRLLLYGSLIGLLLPVGIRWGIPELAQAVGRSELLAPQTTSAMTITIHGNTWQITSPQHPPRSLQLAGLKPVAPIWQNQANTVAIMLLEASRNQVDVQFLSAESPLALVRLPNGTLLQEVLLTQGLAELDPNQKNLPADIAALLRQAQQSAQQQHKNLWGLP